MEHSLETLLAEATFRCQHMASGAVPLPWQMQPFTADCDRLYLIRGGRGWVAIDDQRFSLRPGMVLLIPTGAIQQGETAPGHPMDLLWIHFYCQTLDTLPLLRILPMPICLQGDSARSMHRTGAVMWDEWGSQTPGRELALKHALLEMVLCAYRAPQKDHRQADAKEPSCKKNTGKDTEQIRMIQQVLHLVETRFHAPLSLQDLALHAGLHPTHFHRVFRSFTGMPPMKFLEQRRLRYARELLATTALPIHEISLQCGYEDPYYFSRVFRKDSGQSPSAFRASIGTNTPR